MAHWRKNHESKSTLLTSADLFDEQASEAKGAPVYRRVVVKIARVGSDLIKSAEKPNGERRNFAYFVGEKKPLGLNATNCKTLTALFGSPDTKAWEGKTIGLYVDPNAKYPKGETGPAIRIHPKIPSSAAAPIPPVDPSTRERLEDEKAKKLGETNEEVDPNDDGR